MFGLLVGYVQTARAQHSPASAAAAPSIAKPLTGEALPCTGGHIGTFACENVELLSFLPTSALGGAAGFDLWGWTDSATGREFVIITGEGTAFVEVTNPVEPRYLGRLPLHDNASGGIPGVKVYKNHAFIAAEGVASQGVQVFDLTQLRNVKSPPVVFQETAHYDKLGSAHTLALNPETGFAYASGSLMGGETCGSGLHMIDVRTPTKPTFAGCYTDGTAGLPIPGYIHDTQCVVYHGPDQQYKGKEICVIATGNDLGIVDVTNKRAPEAISFASYPNASYTHQGWFTEDQRYFFLDDERDEGTIGHTRTIGFDMSDLDDPVVLTEFLHTTTSTDHNLYIHGHYMYQGNYDAGLRIIDVADPRHPKEAGYLAQAGSAWGTYPFLKNDVVAVSMSTGLFLARLQTRAP